MENQQYHRNFHIQVEKAIGNICIHIKWNDYFTPNNNWGFQVPQAGQAPHLLPIFHGSRLDGARAGLERHALSALLNPFVHVFLLQLFHHGGERKWGALLWSWAKIGLTWWNCSSLFWWHCAFGFMEISFCSWRFLFSLYTPSSSSGLLL